MSRLRKLLRLSPGQLCHLCQISLLLLLAEASLRLWSLRAILRALQRRSVRAHLAGRAPPGLDDLPTLTGLVELADRHSLFRPSCLRKAVTLAWLLAGRGLPSTVRIGATQEQGQFRAHAWLDLEGTPPVSIFKGAGYVELLAPSTVPEPQLTVGLR